MILITFGIHLYEICTKNVFVIFLVYFQLCSNKKKVTKVKQFFFLTLMPKRGQNYPSLNF